jgi:hypothetical protein
MVKIMHSELMICPAKIRTAYNQALLNMRSTLARYFAAQKRAGLLRDVKPETAARIFLGALFSYFRTEEIIQGRDITKNGQMAAHVKEFVDILSMARSTGEHHHDIKSSVWRMKGRARRSRPSCRVLIAFFRRFF